MKDKIDYYKRLKLYQEIDIADKEFEEGETISHEELFNVEFKDD